jgi:P27 family predicted phage terminase small subunit
MIRGRKPVPTELRKLRGNPRDHALPADEPVVPPPPPEFDDVPPVIADDAVAAAEWTRLAPLLREARIITEADRNVLIAACQQWSIYQHALTQAPPDRRVLRSPNDYPIPNPFIPMANKALLHCERLWEQLGLTPSARSRVTAAKQAPEDDPFAEFDEPQAPRLPKGPTLNGRTHASTPRPS